MGEFIRRVLEEQRKNNPSFGGSKRFTGIDVRDNPATRRGGGGGGRPGLPGGPGRRPRRDGPDPELDAPGTGPRRRRRNLRGTGTSGRQTTLGGNVRTPLSP